MDSDLVKIYTRNQLVPFSVYVFVAAGFLALKLYMYGFDDRYFLFVLPGVLIWGFTRIESLRKLYSAAVSEKESAEQNWRKIVVRIACDKAAYMIPWLIILFWPFETTYLYDLLPGYGFVFCAMAAYATASSPYFPLYLWDAGIPLLFALGVTALNSHVQGTPYIAAVLLMFGIYTLISARNIRQSMQQLVKNRRALQKMAARAAQANKAKSDFLALMSHEIRTPMTGVLGMIDFLGETRLTEEQAECLATIQACSKTLLNTINDILDFSKIESGKLAISKIKYDLHSILNKSAAVLRPIAEEKGVAIDVSIDAKVPKLGYGDPHRVQQIVLNLLNNAVKFTERGGVTLTASYKMSGNVGMTRVEVKDTGIGMDDETQAKLFKKFSQADDSISRKYGGSGLGLSIAKQLVELMGGEIGVRSKKGQGSTFWFEIPYVAARADAGEKIEEAETESRVRPEDTLDILVVEDNKVNQMISTRTLAKKGHRVTVADTGDMAVAKLKQTKFDLVLMDINLPGKSGIDTTKEIRALGGRFKDVPIIALTANVTEDHMKRCRQAGMADYVLKPFTSEELYQAIARHRPARTGKPAEQLAAAPVPAETKTKEGAYPALNHKLVNIREEFGPEYMAQMIEMCGKEIEGLIIKGQSAYDEKNYEVLGNCAHDIKSVSGSIGLRDVQELAHRIETLCNDRQYAPLQQSVPDLVSTARKEIDKLSVLSSQVS